jgi:hypothetical protein
MESNMMENLVFETAGNPGLSGVYMVDRGENQGKAFRYFDQTTGKWSITCYDPQEAYTLRGTATALPFLPYHPNPIKVKAVDANEVKMQPAVGGPSAKALAIVKAADAKILKAVTKPAKAPKVKAPKQPDGTVFFRADRNKWVVIVDGKQPAARPTKEAVVKWLAKAHPSIKPTIVE